MNRDKREEERVKELLVFIAHQLGMEGTYKARFIFDILYENGLMTKEERERMVWGDQRQL